jgi:hypothetical protein
MTALAGLAGVFRVNDLHPKLLGFAQLQTPSFSSFCILVPWFCFYLYFLNTTTTNNKKCCSKRPLQMALSDTAFHPTIKTVGFQATFSVNTHAGKFKPNGRSGI